MAVLSGPTLFEGLNDYRKDRIRIELLLIGLD